MRLGAEAGVAAAFFLIGLAPLLLANIASGGATFREVFGTANSPSVQFSPPLPPGLAGVAQALYLQIAATLLVGLPHALGINVVCGSCAIWPLPTDGVTAGALVWAAVVSVVFTVFAILCWALAALPLARDVLRDAPRHSSARQGTTALPRWRVGEALRRALVGAGDAGSGRAGHGGAIRSSAARLPLSRHVGALSRWAVLCARRSSPRRSSPATGRMALARSPSSGRPRRRVCRLSAPSARPPCSS